MQKYRIITLLIWKLIRPLPSEFSLMRYICFGFFFSPGINIYNCCMMVMHQNVVWMYAFLECNGLRNHHGLNDARVCPFAQLVMLQHTAIVCFDSTVYLFFVSQANALSPAEKEKRREVQKSTLTYERTLTFRYIRHAPPSSFFMLYFLGNSEAAIFM